MLLGEGQARRVHERVVLELVIRNQACPDLGVLNHWLITNFSLPYKIYKDNWRLAGLTRQSRMNTNIR